MEAYTEFAQVYDRFMDNVPYEAWCEGISKILTEHGISEGLVLDLGCGTGTMTRLLRQKGYDMIGVDASAEMLEIARNHPDEGILYLQQDMREFELYGTVAAVVCVCDSLNYLLEEEDLAEVFSLVHNYLDQNGVFIIDMNTIHKYRDLIGGASRECRCRCIPGGRHAQGRWSRICGRSSRTCRLCRCAGRKVSWHGYGTGNGW